MDFSSAADVPLGKAFDEIIESDPRGNFMIEHSAKCFNLCIPKIDLSSLKDNEKTCLKDCYAKSYYSYLMVEGINLK